MAINKGTPKSTPPRLRKTKILSPDRLLKLLRQERTKSRSTSFVFTNGCFDILHQGHVAYLEKARSLGTRLIVALNTDASVQILKGPSRPINPLKDRREVIAALESVDYVTWFNTETPYDLIKQVAPDWLVKGGDWKPSQIVGAEVVLARGGKVRSIPLSPGRSTTNVVKKIAARKLR